MMMANESSRNISRIKRTLADAVSQQRLFHPITRTHLQCLAELAATEEHRFFEKNASAALYKDRLLAVALCQGAALHCVDLKNGVKDFDIHFFYLQHPAKKRLARAVKHVIANFPIFGMRRVDFIRTVIPEKFVAKNRSEVSALLRAFLQQRPTPNACHLAEKAVVGLFPSSLLGKIIWARVPLAGRGGVQPAVTESERPGCSRP